MAFSETTSDYEALFGFFFNASQYNPCNGDLTLADDGETIRAWQDLSHQLLTERGHDSDSLRALSRMVVEDVIDTHEKFYTAIPDIFAGTLGH